QLNRAGKILGSQGASGLFEQIHVPRQHVIQDVAWLVADLLESSPQAQRRGCPSPQRGDQLAFEVGEAGVAQALCSTDDGGIAGAELLGDLESRDEANFFAMLGEETRHALLGRSEL